MKVNGIDGVAAQICFVRISESVTDDRASEGTRVEVVDRGVMLGRATPTGASRPGVGSRVSRVGIGAGAVSRPQN